MASLLKKRQDPIQDFEHVLHNSQNDTQDLALADDSEDLGQGFGTLTFTEEDNKGARRDKATTIVQFEGDFSSTCNVRFEVTSADKVKEGRSSYVLYTILISRFAGINKIPASICKRYSDFEKLNVKLRKKFPAIMEDVAFPKKLFTGNFSSENIARRSRAFEQYLSHVFHISDTQNSEELRDFFYLQDIKDSMLYLGQDSYANAFQLLEKSLPIQEKLLGDFHPEVVNTLCAIVACNYAMELYMMAHRYAETALKCLRNNDRDEHLVPLLQLSIRVCWTLGKDKKDLETRLQQIGQKGLPVDEARSLMDVVKSTGQGQDHCHNMAPKDITIRTTAPT